MGEVSDLHNKMYKDHYDNGLSKLINLLIDKFAIPRAQVINEFVSEGETLVDLGCGTGIFCGLAAPKFQKIYGLDFAAESVESAKKMKIENAEFKLFDLNQSPLPFSDQSVDTVTSIATLDYVYNLNSLIQETNRILKPAGKFIFQVNNLGFLPRRLRLLLGKYPNVSSVAKDEWPRIGWDASACHYFTKSELKRFLNGFGFSTTKITGSGIFRRFRRWWPALLCGDLIFVCKKTSSLNI